MLVLEPQDARVPSPQVVTTQCPQTLPGGAPLPLWAVVTLRYVSLTQQILVAKAYDLENVGESCTRLSLKEERVCCCCC